MFDPNCAVRLNGIHSEEELMHVLGQWVAVPGFKRMQVSQQCAAICEYTTERLAKMERKECKRKIWAVSPWDQGRAFLIKTLLTLLDKTPDEQI